jgi:glycosyltransferase involved in cell wall biosynthesis
MRYWIVTEVFYPEEVSTGYVMTKIAEKISEYAEIGVICGSAEYQSDAFKAAYTLSDSILIKRIRIPKLNKNFFLSRIFGFSLFALAVGIRILYNVKPGDKIILVTNPPTLLPLIAFLKKFKNFGLVILVHDVFPENAAASGLIKRESYLFRVLSSVFNSSYKSADRLITVGSDMKEVFLEKIGNKLPIEVITNWADHHEIYPMETSDFSKNYALKSKGKTIIQFAGNIGRVQGLELLFQELSSINNNLFHLIIIGDGAQKKYLQDFVYDNNLENIQFISSRSRSEQNNFLNACDIGLVTLCPGMFGLGVPSKVYNIFSAGKPVIYIGDTNSEISRYINDNLVGWAFSWDNKLEIKEFFEKIGDDLRSQIITRGKNARALVERDYTKDKILQSYKEEIFKI